MGRRLERVEELEIVQMYESGVSVVDIEVEMDVSRTVIYRILKSEEVPLRALRNIGRPSHLDNMSEADIEAFALDYAGGMKIWELMDKWKIRSSKSLYELIHLLQIPLRLTSKSNLEAKELRIKKAMQMYKDGFYLWEIENETGLFQPEIHKHLHRRDIPLRRHMSRAKLGK
jgi:transposase